MSELHPLVSAPSADRYAPKSREELVRRLQGQYRTPITDGLGPAGGEEPDNPLEHVRTFQTPTIQKEAAAEIEALGALVDKLQAVSIESIWEQAQQNHAAYSATGDTEDDLRFFTLGLVGEAGELANFVKKRWRDGDGHDDDMRKECADVLAYLMMLAHALGMTPAELVAMVAHKQQVFVEKMKARRRAERG